jgi:hypothetical protein
MAERNFQFNLGSWDITASNFDDAKRYLLDDLAEFVDISHLAKFPEPDTTLLGAAKAYHAIEPKGKKRRVLWNALGEAIANAENRNGDVKAGGRVVVTLTKAEHSTVLAALRRWQHHIDGTAADHEGLDEIATCAGDHDALTAEQIDALCEDINCTEPTED